MTAIELITKDDLKTFRTELLNDIKELLKPGLGEQKKWLKSYEVKKLMNISSGTLQTLRINRTLHFTKIGGILYYKQEDILHLLEGGH